MKKILSLVMSLVLAVGIITPAFAQGSEISMWAVPTLNEGERYGLYSNDWYENGFTEQVTVEQLKFLRQNLLLRFDEADFERKETIGIRPIEGPLTKGAVALIYYDVLMQYGLAENVNEVEALQRLSVLQGSEKGLNLEGPCTTQEAVVMAIRLMSAVFNVKEAGAQGIMWKVQNEDITLYLLGTIHTGNNLIFPMSSRVMNAFNESDALILEAIMSQEEIAKFQAQLYYPEGKTIRDDLSEETIAKLEKVLKMDGLTFADVEKVRAWHITNQYTQAMLTVLSSNTEITNAESTNALSAIDHGQSRVELGIDNYFISLASLYGKPMYQLESLEQQAILFNGLSKETVDKELSSVLDFFLMSPEERAKEIEKSVQNQEVVDPVKEWLALWRTGDVDGFTKSFAPQITDNEKNRMLFGKRDVHMAESLKELLESGKKGTFFVAVGSGHYVGEKSIIFNLKNMGFKVEVCK